MPAWTGAAFWRWLTLVSGALELVALLGFVTLVIETLRRGPPLRSRPALTSIAPFVVRGGLALALAAMVNFVDVIHGATQTTIPPGLMSPTGNTLDVTLGLFGFLVSMAPAMSARSLPMYVGLDAFPRHILWPLAWAGWGWGLWVH